MLLNDFRSIREIGNKIEKDIEEMVSKNLEDTYADEEDITSQFAQSLTKSIALDSEMLNIECAAVIAKKTTEEPSLGADIMVVYAYHSPYLKVSSGLLAQAKRLPGNGSIGSEEDMKKFRIQCRKMLNHSNESYAWLYRTDGFTYQRAGIISKLSTIYPHDAIYEPLGCLFWDVLLGIRGDSNLSLDNFSRLQRAIEKLQVSNIVVVSVSDTREIYPRPKLRRTYAGRPYPIVKRLDKIQEIVKTYSPKVKLILRGQTVGADDGFTPGR